MKAALVILVLIALALAAGAYYFFDANRKTLDELKSLKDANDKLNFKVGKLETEKSQVTQELEQKIDVISKEKEEEINRLKGTYDELLSDMKDEIEQGQIKITQLADRLSISMVDKILFPSGEAAVTRAGVRVLERVGKVLKGTRDKIIRVEGHTDNVPISSKLEKKFPTNWELSTSRACNVVRFLQEEVGIPGSRLQAVGMSEYKPVATNETASGRGQNRRIEILLLPLVSEEMVSK